MAKGILSRLMGGLGRFGDAPEPEPGAEPGAAPQPQMAAGLVPEPGPQPDDDPVVEYEGDLRNALRRDLPSLALRSHDGATTDLSALNSPAVLFTFPHLGVAGVPWPEGWDQVPDADGSAALACSFRDAMDDFERFGIKDLFGVSSQTVPELREAAHRLALPFPVLSDPRLQLAFEIDLPRVFVAHQSYFAPTVLVVQRGVVVAGLQPGREPATAAARLLTRLKEVTAEQRRAAQEAKE
ncbi:MAG: hypothetical protein AAF092_02300 [Pseudomonadota bacterium]